MLLTA